MVAPVRLFTKSNWRGAAILSLALAVSACAYGLPCKGVAPSAGIIEHKNSPDNDVGRSIDDQVGFLIKTMSPADLTCWAKKGDSVAQYALGRAYELGQAGLGADRYKAIRYYRQAARPAANTSYVYSPPVGKESSGRVIPVTTGPASPGLAEAMAALKRLEDSP